MRKFKSFWEYEITEAPTLIYDIEDFQNYMEELILRSEIDEFNANKTASKILIL